MESAIRVQIFDEAVFIWHNANTYGKRMNSTSDRKIAGQTEFFNLGMATSLEEKLWIQNC